MTSRSSTWFSSFLSLKILKTPRNCLDVKTLKNKRKQWLEVQVNKIVCILWVEETTLLIYWSESR